MSKFQKTIALVAALIGIFVFVTGITDLPSMLFDHSDSEEVVVIEPRIIDDNGTIEVGSRKYKVVKLGTQIWMAENLNLYIEGTKKRTISDTVYRFYTFDQAIEAANKVRGWHLPSNAEWDELIDYFGGNMEVSETDDGLMTCACQEVIDKFSNSSLFNTSYIVSPEYIYDRDEEVFWSSTSETNIFGFNQTGFKWSISLDNCGKISDHWHHFNGAIKRREVSISDDPGYKYYSVRLVKDL